jgi:hypothetical protein
MGPDPDGVVSFAKQHGITIQASAGSATSVLHPPTYFLLYLNRMEPP